MTTMGIQVVSEVCDRIHSNVIDKMWDQLAGQIDNVTLKQIWGEIDIDTRTIEGLRDQVQMSIRIQSHRFHSDYEERSKGDIRGVTEALVGSIEPVESNRPKHRSGFD